jgi:hypothetical protein
MATPSRKLILDNIKTVLEAINIAGGYKTTVKNVEPVIKDWDAVTVEERPWIGFMPRQQIFQHLPNGQIRVILPILVGAHVCGDDQDDREAKVTDLEDDIVRALGVDTTRGGNAVSTMITSTQDDLGDPDSTDHDGPSGTLEVEAQVVYMRTFAGT